jgi:hypothetical protein
MRVLKSCLLVVLLVAGAGVPAQDISEIESDTSVIIDTGVTAVVKDSVFQFDTITASALSVEAKKIPDSTMQRLRSDDAFWYANATFKKPEPPRNLSWLQQLFSQAWFRNLIWAIIVCSFVVVLILFLMKSNIQLFHRKPAALQTSSTSALGENIFSIDYESEIVQAKRAGDLRLAVRLYYLQTLALLSGQHLIQYKEDRTNSEYVAQLRQSPLYAPFKKLTRHFEYTWYGQFPVSPGAFANMETDFSTFKNSMGI